ncbi:MAG: tetratricopeptide repeat protein [Lysobacterales bacterium]
MSVRPISGAFRVDPRATDTAASSAWLQDRWAAVEALFEACADVDPAERSRLLSSADPELRREVESLLQHLAGNPQLPDSIEQAGFAALTALQPWQAGSRLGPYRLLCPLGEGGMGMVWLAERADGQFEQQVALKFVAVGGDQRGWQTRFLTERQILARLQHPHIARLLDGGSTATGQPYLVMEHVDGESLHAYCDRRQLGVEARLQLLLQICSAVDYAHRHLVVHRDLKPANILVSETDGPKLLDFGIARMLDDRAGRVSRDLTAPGERMLTPNYASPEQLLGEAVTTASDVYALGVLLYELLTGRRPHAVEGESMAARYRLIADAPTQRPSLRVRRQTCAAELISSDPALDAEALAKARGYRPLALERRLRGDLDTIVLRALQRDPARRYRSAADLADDLQRHLQGQPVQARPDAWHYRLAKLCQRQPVAMTAVAGLMLLTVVFVIGLWLQAERLASERDRALAAEGEARAVSSYLVDLFEVSDPLQDGGGNITARELLDRGSASIATKLTEQPLVQASLLYTLGDVNLNLGLLEQAVDLHRRALVQRERLLGPDHPDTLASRDRLGDGLRQISQFDEAEVLLRDNLARREALSDTPAWALGDSLNNLGLLLSTIGQRSEAEPLLRRALAVREASLGVDHKLTLISRSNLGLLLLDSERLSEAEAPLTDVLARRRALLGQHPQVANSAQALGTLQLRQGHMDRAESLFREALAMRRQLLPIGHPSLANSLNELAYLYHDQLRLDEAEGHYREMLAIDRLNGSEPRLNTAYGLNNLASLLQDRARYGEAAALFEESIRMRVALLGDSSDNAQRVRLNLAQMHLQAGDPMAARALLDAVRERLPAAPADNPRMWLDLWRREAEWMLEQEQPVTAIERLRQALQLSGEAGIDGWRELELSIELARVQGRQSDQRCRQTLAAVQTRIDAETLPLRRARALLAEGQCALAESSPLQAAAAFDRALALVTPGLPISNHWVQQLRTARASVPL